MTSSEGGVSVIVRAGDYESVHYALALAAAVLAVNKPAVLFFTMAGIRASRVHPRLSTIDARCAESGARRRRLETLLQAASSWRTLHRVRNGPAFARHDRAGLRSDVPLRLPAS
jgi:hypothetical protein